MKPKTESGRNCPGLRPLFCFVSGVLLLSAVFGAYTMKTSYISDDGHLSDIAAASDADAGTDVLREAVLPVSTSEGAMGWYFAKTDDHTQPPLDAPLSYVESLDAYYIDHAHASQDGDKVIYLTFDAGYENGNIAKILDTLKKHNAVGAFFVLSHLIESNTDLVCRMAEEGHLVCNHTCRHKDMTAVSNEEFKAELQGLEALYQEKTGKTLAPYFRPPEGKFDRRSLTRAQKLGYKTVFWSFAYCDWDNNHQPAPDAAAETILSHTHNGMVLLLHPTSATNAAILDRLLCAWEEEGYRFGTLDELTSQPRPEAGDAA